jgi:hypothetical protein
MSSDARSTLWPAGADLDAAMHIAGGWYMAGMDWSAALAVAADEMCQGLDNRPGQWVVGREWKAAAGAADILSAYMDHLAHRVCPELFCRGWSVDPVLQAGQDVAVRLAANWAVAVANRLDVPSVSGDEIHVMLARAASW